VVHPSGAVLELGRLGDLGPAGAVDPAAAPVDVPAAAAARPAVAAGTTSLREAADALDAAFSEALAAREVDGCVAAILELEQILADWSADTLTSDEGQHAHGLLRGMVVRLGGLAEAGARDPRAVLGPFVAALLEMRDEARRGRDWAASDRIRARLADAGVEVRDTPDGATWVLS
jgi:cysteinyl-tRNA synthetase